MESKSKSKGSQAARRSRKKQLQARKEEDEVVGKDSAVCAMTALAPYANEKNKEEDEEDEGEEDADVAWLPVSLEPMRKKLVKELILFLTNIEFQRRKFGVGHGVDLPSDAVCSTFGMCKQTMIAPYAEHLDNRSFPINVVVLGCWLLAQDYFKNTANPLATRLEQSLAVGDLPEKFQSWVEACSKHQAETLGLKHAVLDPLAGNTWSDIPWGRERLLRLSTIQVKGAPVLSLCASAATLPPAATSQDKVPAATMALADVKGEAVSSRAAPPAAPAAIPSAATKERYIPGCVVCLENEAVCVQDKCGHLTVCRACRRKFVHRELVLQGGALQGCKARHELRATDLERTLVPCPLCRTSGRLILVRKFTGRVLF